jgi:hypothetical protein
MDWKSARSVETKIRRLTREIERIDAVFYESEKAKERDLYVGMLERKRDDRVRSVVLQMHTAIEDILNDLMTCRILGIPPDERHRKTRSKSARALHKLFVGGGSIGFERKLNLAIAIGVDQVKDTGTAPRSKQTAQQMQSQLALKGSVTTRKEAAREETAFTALSGT